MADIKIPVGVWEANAPEHWKEVATMFRECGLIGAADVLVAGSPTAGRDVARDRYDPDDPPPDDPPPDDADPLARCVHHCHVAFTRTVRRCQESDDPQACIDAARVCHMACVESCRENH